MIYVVFVEPESPGNIGFLARTMKNFAFNDLVLINPCELKKEAYYQAMHAKDIIWNHKEYGSLEEFIEAEKIDFTVGTTRMAGGSYNVSRIAVTPEQFAESLNITGNIAIVFGREGNGLYNEEIALCDVVVTIPTNDEYPVLNISHAAAIVLYELFKREKNYPREELEVALKSEKELLIEEMDELIKYTGYPEHKMKTASTVFKNIIGRAFISGREAHTLIGTLRRLGLKLKE
ncbi:RNA methyltransferase [Methanobacterium sp. MBAC-LM]|uniref:RNA methyltransferase n=1 Tax=Methanobacterium sp. MBAC-LM TaxID=3412034 RepID=UPI003C72CA41